MRVILVGGPLDGARATLSVPASQEVFLVGRVPVGVTLGQFETALAETGAAASPAGRRALTLLASRVSAARYGRVGGRLLGRLWGSLGECRYSFVDEGPLWVADTCAGPRLALTRVPDYPPG